ncbi:MAG: hypothetical protein LBE49_05950 [Deltaproteobacteria bacterium]|jgi:hypothetical protein|nr:hypothetical protein [Deltaproteobacteria bacterium]
MRKALARKGARGASDLSAISAKARAVLAIAVFSAFFVTGCFSLPPSPAELDSQNRLALAPSEQEAIIRAQNLTFVSGGVSNVVKIIEEPSVVINKPSSMAGRVVRIIKVDGQDITELWIPKVYNVGFFPPGTHTFTYHIPEVSSFDEMQYTFEKGKHYEVKYKTGGFLNTDISLNFFEVTDPDDLGKINSYLEQYRAAMQDRLTKAQEVQAPLTEYLAFSQKNPNYLEGKWINIDNNRDLQFHGKKMRSLTTLLFKPWKEGDYIFNKNTIIVDFDRDIFEKGGVILRETPGAQPFLYGMTYIYYVLDNEILHVKYSSHPTVSTGDYRRVQ